MAENGIATTLEPGAIDRTRKNIGAIDAKEALEMQKKLGGQILKERSAPSEPSTMPKRHHREAIVRASGRTSSEAQSRSGSGSHGGSGSGSGSGSAQGNSQGAASPAKLKKIHTDDDLPDVSSKELKLMDRLMMLPEFELKADFGFLNVLFRLSSRNKEKLQKSFGDYLIPRHVEHIQGFLSSMKTFIQISPDVYKAKIATEGELKFRLLRTVAKWNVKDIKTMAQNLQNSSDYLTIPMMIPFVKSVFRQFLQIYYVGEKQISVAIKEVHDDLVQYSDSDAKKISAIAAQAVSEWLYIHDYVIKGLYPLLMRMCSTEYDEFPGFFKNHLNDILRFLDMSKFDLMIPDKKAKNGIQQTTEDKKIEEETEKEKEALEKKRNYDGPGMKDEFVGMGLRILEQLFPEAGFSRIGSSPDLYPYFQPIYNFPDGFNILDPENPLQVTVVLIRILEDFFKGCRNIDFNLEADEGLSTFNDSIQDAMGDWGAYREDLFDKKYGDYLRSYVNSTYSQPDFPNTQFGKDTLNNILWRTKFYFLPGFKFNAPVLQKPLNDTKYKPFFNRIYYLRKVFSTLAKRIDESGSEHGDILGVVNPWNRYNFDLPNPISKRIDILLGANRSDTVTAATNANLIKYTMCIMSVLDWWVNNDESPAYAKDSLHVFRVSAQDGAPEFSVPVRSDQNTLFTEGVKKAIAAKKSKNAENGGA